MGRTARAAAAWIPAGIGIAAALAFAYLAVQQSWRMGADWPQVQMAEDAAAHLAGGGSPAAYDPAEKVDVAASLAPWLAVYDDEGKPVAASGTLAGRPASLPAGVLDSARTGEHRVTWQPRPGVRVATVIRRFDGRSKGFVVAGRSLREAERHIVNLGRLGVLAALLAFAASLAAALVLARWSSG